MNSAHFQYEIQTYTLCEGWVNSWTDENETPVVFDTLEQAEAELSEYLADLQQALDAKDLAEFNPSDYRVVAVGSHTVDSADSVS